MRNLKSYLVIRVFILWVVHPALLLTSFHTLLTLHDPLVNQELITWLLLAPVLIGLFHVAEIASGVRWDVQTHQIKALVEKGV